MYAPGWFHDLSHPGAMTFALALRRARRMTVDLAWIVSSIAMAFACCGVARAVWALVNSLLAKS